jgi:hypothetical protein
MSIIKQILKKTILISLLTLLIAGCVKDNFTEPPDPFIKQRLEEGHVSFQFGNGVDSFKILTNSENVTFTDKGNIRIRGSIFADRDTLAPVRLSQGDFILLKNVGSNQKSVYLEEYGELPLSKGSFKLLNSSGSPSTEFQGFGGYSEFTLPQVGLIQDMEIPLVDGSPIGFAQGSELPDFPVNPNNTYFYFYYDDLTDFVLSQSAFSISRMALDPDDPYFYVHANAMSIPGLNSLEEGGFATSVQGNIPFEVPSSLSFGNVESFNYGNIMLEGSINLESFGVPIVIDDANCTIGFGNMIDGQNFFNGGEVPMMMGLKGGFVLVVAEIVEWKLGDAAVSLRIGSYDDFEFSYAAYFDNEMSIFEPIERLTGIDASSSAFDFIQPPQEARTISTWGTLSSNIDDWTIGLKSESYMDFPGVMRVDMGSVEFEASNESLYFDCRMPISLFSSVGLSGEIKESGAFKLKAYTSAGESFGKWGLSIDIGYRAHFLLDVKSISDWYFEIYGKAYLDISIGQPWFDAHGITEFNDLSDPRVKASISFKVTLQSSGKFSGYLKFSIWGKGYKLKFSFKLNSSEQYSVESLEEIPLDEVPIENRFQIQ